MVEGSGSSKQLTIPLSLLFNNAQFAPAVKPGGMEVWLEVVAGDQSPLKLMHAIKFGEAILPI